LDPRMPLRIAQESSMTTDDVYVVDDDNNERSIAADGANLTYANGSPLHSCGSRQLECDASLCMVAIPTDSLLLRQILKDLDNVVLDDASSDESSINAASILEGLSKASQEEKRRRKAAGNGSDNNPSTGTVANPFMPPQDGISNNLQFWKDCDSSSDGRSFPPLLQVLLLKLLYASPVGGPFLKLACVAVPHLSL